MQKPQPGQRLPAGAFVPCRISLTGQAATQVAVAAVTTDGRFISLDQEQTRWSLEQAEALGDRFEIVAYMKGDLTSGFVNGSYPIIAHIEGAGDDIEMPIPNQPLAMVILAEVYTKDGSRRIKISNEGFALGIDSYAKARNFKQDQIPHRSAPGQATPMQGDPRYQQAPSQGGPRLAPGQELGAGSGVIIGPDLIITNAHVIENGSQFLLGRGRQPLNPVAVDQTHDLALLQGPVQGQGLPLRIASPLWLGEGIMAAGYPLSDILGADLKVTTGNISGLVGPLNDVSRFQFSAPIASGSSGGAIIDEQGNLVGITSASLAHDHMRQRGAISENVNFGIRACLVYEMIAAAGMDLPAIATANQVSENRRDVIQRVRQSVIGITVLA